MRAAIAALMLAACGGATPAGERPAEPADDLDTAAVGRVALSPTRAVEPGEADAEGRAESGTGTKYAAPTPRQIREPSTGRPRRLYRGRRIDLNVKDADLTNLYRFLATVGGVNIVVAPDVRGRVTLRLRQVPWDQIADVVARTHQLEIERDGGIWLIRKRLERDPRGQR